MRRSPFWVSPYSRPEREPAFPPDVPMEDVLRALIPEWADTLMVHIQSPRHNSQIVMWPAKLHEDPNGPAQTLAG